MREMLLEDFAIIILIVAVLWAVYNIFIHISCFIARITKKKVCFCWECAKKCELYKRSEPEVSDELDGYQYFVCSYCGHIIDRVGVHILHLKKFHKYCGHCGNTLCWSFLDLPEDEQHIEPFGTGKTLTAKYKFMKKEDYEDDCE